jgi:hypothetical protein
MPKMISPQRAAYLKKLEKAPNFAEKTMRKNN